MKPRTALARRVVLLQHLGERRRGAALSELPVAEGPLEVDEASFGRKICVYFTPGPLRAQLVYPRDLRDL